MRASIEHISLHIVVFRCYEDAAQIISLLKCEHDVNCGLDSTGSGHVPVEGSCEHGNEHSGYTERDKLVGVLSPLLNRKAIHRAHSSPPGYCPEPTD